MRMVRGTSFHNLCAVLECARGAMSRASRVFHVNSWVLVPAISSLLLQPLPERGAINPAVTMLMMIITGKRGGAPARGVVRLTENRAVVVAMVEGVRTALAVAGAIPMVVMAMMAIPAMAMDRRHLVAGVSVLGIRPID